MSILDSLQYPLWLNFILFGVGATGVWFAGTKLSRYVDMIADRTGMGTAFAGALLLGGATSLPEIATTITAALSDAVEMVGTNLLGGIAMQLSVLAAIDAIVLRGKPLTLFSPKAELLGHGMLLILMIALAIAGICSGEILSLGGIGFWSVFILLVYGAGLWLMYHYEGNARWSPDGEVKQPPESARDLKDAYHAPFAAVKTSNITLRFLIAAAAVFVFGFIVARSGEALAEQTGLGQSLVGATLVALATSLPEVSTTWSAVRFGAYSMAVANILGTNALEVALFLPADIAYRNGSIFDQMSPNVGVLGALGIVLTCIYLVGILERRDKTLLGMGIDSFIVLVVYVLGMVLFGMR